MRRLLTAAPLRLVDVAAPLGFWMAQVTGCEICFRVVVAFADPLGHVDRTALARRLGPGFTGWPNATRVKR
jgi:hypothetical protein